MVREDFLVTPDSSNSVTFILIFLVFMLSLTEDKFKEFCRLIVWRGIMVRSVTFFAVALFSTSISASEVGVVNGIQASVIGPCGQLLVTGQFVAPKEVTSVKLKVKDVQASVTTLELEVVTGIADDATGDHLLPFDFSTDDHSCPYGVSVSFGDQTVLDGVSVAQPAKSPSP